MGRVPELGEKLRFLYKDLPAARRGALPAGYLVCDTQAAFAEAFGVTSQAIGNAKKGVSGERADGQPSAPMERAIAYRYGFGPPQNRLPAGGSKDQVDDAWEDWFKTDWPGWRGTAKDFMDAYASAIDGKKIAPLDPEQEPLRSALAALQAASDSRRRSPADAVVRPAVPVAPGNAARDLRRFAMHAGQMSRCTKLRTPRVPRIKELAGHITRTLADNAATTRPQTCMYRATKRSRTSPQEIASSPM